MGDTNNVTSGETLYFQVAAVGDYTKFDFDLKACSVTKGDDTYFLADLYKENNVDYCIDTFLATGFKKHRDDAYWTFTYEAFTFKTNNQSDVSLTCDIKSCTTQESQESGWCPEINAGCINDENLSKDADKEPIVIKYDDCSGILFDKEKKCCAGSTLSSWDGIACCVNEEGPSQGTFFDIHPDYTCCKAGNMGYLKYSGYCGGEENVADSQYGIDIESAVVSSDDYCNYVVLDTSKKCCHYQPEGSNNKCCYNEDQVRGLLTSEDYVRWWDYIMFYNPENSCCT